MVWYFYLHYIFIQNKKYLACTSFLEVTWSSLAHGMQEMCVQAVNKLPIICADITFYTNGNQDSLYHYSNTYVKRPLKNRQNKDLNDKW